MFSKIFLPGELVRPAHQEDYAVVAGHMVVVAEMAGELLVGHRGTVEKVAEGKFVEWTAVHVVYLRLAAVGGDADAYAADVFQALDDGTVFLAGHAHGPQQRVSVVSLYSMIEGVVCLPGGDVQIFVAIRKEMQPQVGAVVYGAVGVGCQLLHLGAGLVLFTSKVACLQSYKCSFNPQAVFDTEGKGGGLEVEAIHLGLEAGDAGGAYMAGADDILQVDADIAFLADGREVERQRHNKVPRGERVDVVGTTPRGGEENVAGAHAKARRGFEDENLGQGDAVAEVEVEMRIVFLDKLVLHCDSAAAIRPIDIQPQGEPTILYPGTDAALYGAEVCAAVIERGKVALHVVGESLAAVEEAGAEVQVGPDIPFRFFSLVFLCANRATSQHTCQQHKAFQTHFLKQYFHDKILFK